MEGNVLVHVSAPALGLSAGHWAVASWGQSQLTRESVYDAKYIYRYDISALQTRAWAFHYLQRPRHVLIAYQHRLHDLA
jgi:hypothetical protein